MVIIGEKINSTLKAVRPAIEAYDTDAIQSLAKKQTEAGSAYIDLNAGMFHNDESERLSWLVNTVQAAVSTPVCLDSPSAAALEAALNVCHGSAPIINSITGEKERYKSILPLVLKFKTKIIALCMDDTGMPETGEERYTIAKRLIGDLTDAGVKPDDIYIDPLVRPVSTGPQYGVAAIETIRRVKTDFSEVHIACGLSNVSYGLPQRKLINQTFLISAMTAGMDSAILDPLDNKLMAFIAAAEAVLGIDEYCIGYLEKHRSGLFEGI